MIRSIVIGPPPRDSHLAAYPAGLRRVTGSGDMHNIPTMSICHHDAPLGTWRIFRKIRNPGRKKFMVAER